MSVSAHVLAQLLENEAREAGAFLALLKKEQAFLQVADVDGLMPLVEQKSALAAKLAELGAARETILAEAGAGSGRSGMETYLSRLPADKALRARWDALLTVASEAQATNQTNGALIRLHLQHNQQAMNTLLAAANKATTYGPDGQQRPAGGGRFLGSA